MDSKEVEASASEIEPIVKALVMSSGDVLTMHEADQKAIARQLAQGGLRLIEDMATHRWVGAEGFGIGAMWAPVDELPAVEASVPDISGLSLRQKTELLQQLQSDGFGGPPEPPALEGDAEVTGDD